MPCVKFSCDSFAKNSTIKKKSLLLFLSFVTSFFLSFFIPKNDQTKVIHLLYREHCDGLARETLTVFPKTNERSKINGTY